MFVKEQNYLRLVIAYNRLNLNAQLEYRSAFFSQVIAMLLNNVMWIIFWEIFFSRFPVLRDWNVNDAITVWALAAAGIGLTNVVYGNALHLARLIVQGQLDVWMLYPRMLLPHLLLGRTNASAWGDIIFGYGVYLVFVKPDFVHLLLFIGLSFSVAVLFVGFCILTGSLSFYIDNATGLAQQWQLAMITFSTYPGILFEGSVKLVLYTLIPAGFITYLPIQALRDLSLVDALLAAAGSLGILAVSVMVFSSGLRRYESGNLIEMRE